VHKVCFLTIASLPNTCLFLPEKECKAWCWCEGDQGGWSRGFGKVANFSCILFMALYVTCSKPDHECRNTHQPLSAGAVFITRARSLQQPQLMFPYCWLFFFCFLKRSPTYEVIQCNCRIVWCCTGFYFSWSSFWFMQLKFEQLPVRFKDSNDVETTEKIEVASTKQVILFNGWKFGHP